MDWEHLLELEYKQNYEQYRWIGQQQSYILTFYGAVVAFASAMLVALKPQTEATLSIYYLWFGITLILIGCVGCLVGYGLFKSRAMQRRTQWYITSILIQLANLANSRKHFNYPALRYRCLCTTGGRFRLLDTMNIAILIAMLSALGLLIIGVLICSVSFNWIIKQTALQIGLIMIPLIWLASIKFGLKYLLDSDMKESQDLYTKASNTRGLDIVRSEFGLPLDWNESDTPE